MQLYSSGESKHLSTPHLLTESRICSDGWHVQIDLDRKTGSSRDSAASILSQSDVCKLLPSFPAVNVIRHFLQSK